MRLNHRNHDPFIAATFLALAPLLLGTSLAQAQEPQPVEPPAVNGQYVPPQAIAVINLHPRAFFSQRALRLMPLELIRATGQKQMGIDPLQIQQIKVVIEQIGPMGPEFGAVVQMAQPAVIESLQSEFVDDEPQATPDGNVFYFVDGPPGVLFHLVDPQTALIGMQEPLHHMLQATGEEPPVAPLLEQVEGSDQVVAILAIEPIRELLETLLDQQLQIAAAVLPPSVLGLRELPALTDHIVFRASAGDRFGAQLTLVAVNDAAAERLENLLTAAMADLRTAIVQQIDPANFGDVESAEAMQAFALRVSGEIVTALTPTRDGNRVAISLDEEVPQMAMFGMFSSISFPLMRMAMPVPREARNQNNLKQIGLALHNYHDTYRGFPDPAIRDAEGKPLLSWRVAILPFVEQAELYNQFRLDEPWDSEHNLALVEKMPPVYKHPSSEAPAGQTVYQAIVGEEIGLMLEGQTGFRNITDGTSNTIAAVEVEDEFAVPWTKPEDVAIDPNDPWPALGGHNTEGVNVLFFDGSVRLIPYWLEPDKLWHLLTRGGGEVVERF